MAGKGDARRPRQVSREQYEANWERCFGRKGKRSGRKKAVEASWGDLRWWLCGLRRGES